MQIPFGLIFAVLFSIETIAAPVPIGDVNEFALEARKAKAVKARPKAVAKKPVVKKPVAKKPVAKKVAAKPVAAKKPAAAAKKPVTVAKKPAAAAKKPATAAKKPATAAKKPATAAKKPATAAKKPTTAAKKPATAAKKPTTAAKKPATAAKPKTSAASKTAPKAPTKSAVKPKASASACALPAKKAAATKAKKPKRMEQLTARLSTFAHEVVIARRTLFGLIQPRLSAGNEFVGWHGTNQDTAALWESRGEIVRPTTAEGQTKGKSGLDAELGPGLYISDTLSVAEAAAAINSQANKIPGKVCAIFAKSSSTYRSSQDKVVIPEIIRGNAAIKEQERASYITNLPVKNTGSNRSLRIGPLTGSTNQMLIPEVDNPKFEAQCFDIVGLDSAGAQAFEDAGNKIKYTSASLISSWKIRKEDAELAKATVAAFEKKCA
ncbi:hypothetical protein C8R43DRAFT_620750 [Mycena crocata]|nr:hypothetical protein C8R43DRAFT_620750 [Mycena crocata]